MTYYNKNYFDWQKNVGAFGGMANLFKFRDFIKPADKVVDFGCGGGYLLSSLHCKEVMGVEINDHAREEAKRNGVNVVKTAAELPDEWADVIISNNALEHVYRPLDELITLHKKLKKGGTVVFNIPHEKHYPYKPNDVNQHLYSWSPMCAGNIFTTAGFSVRKIETIWHKWPPGYYHIRKYMGQTLFDIICSTYGMLRRNWHQVRVVATKP